VYGRRYDVAIGHLDRHAVLAPGIGAIPGHLTVHQSLAFVSSASV
jgi:hypothetical protein